MAAKVISSDQARAKWREVLDTAVAGENVVIERYGKPVAAIIPYQDFRELEEMLEDLRDIREARIALEEWQRDPDSFQPWEEMKREMLKEQTAVYQTGDWEAIKADLIAEIKAELLAEPVIQQALLQAELRQLQKQELQHLEEEFANYE